MGEVIKFPVNNVRTDVQNIPINLESLIDAISKMKLAAFASCADNIVDDVLRSISVLRLDEIEGSEPVDSKDIIMLKESIISILCRMSKVYHPLHAIENTELVLFEHTEDVNGYEVPFFKYRFRSEPEESIRSDS